MNDSNNTKSKRINRPVSKNKAKARPLSEKEINNEKIANILKQHGRDVNRSGDEESFEIIGKALPTIDITTILPGREQIAIDNITIISNHIITSRFDEIKNPPNIKDEIYSEYIANLDRIIGFNDRGIENIADIVDKLLKEDTDIVSEDYPWLISKKGEFLKRRGNALRALYDSPCDVNIEEKQKIAIDSIESYMESAECFEESSKIIPSRKKFQFYSYLDATNMAKKTLESLKNESSKPTKCMIEILEYLEKLYEKKINLVKIRDSAYNANLIADEYRELFMDKKDNNLRIKARKYKAKSAEKYMELYESDKNTNDLRIATSITKDRNKISRDIKIDVEILLEEEQELIKKAEKLYKITKKNDDLATSGFAHGFLADAYKKRYKSTRDINDARKFYDCNIVSGKKLYKSQHQSNAANAYSIAASFAYHILKNLKANQMDLNIQIEWCKMWFNATKSSKEIYESLQMQDEFNKLNGYYNRARKELDILQNPKKQCIPVQIRYG